MAGPGLADTSSGLSPGPRFPAAPPMISCSHGSESVRKPHTAGCCVGLTRTPLFSVKIPREVKAFFAPSSCPPWDHFLQEAGLDCTHPAALSC